MLHQSIVIHAQARRKSIRAQWKAFMRLARRGRNAEAYLN